MKILQIILIILAVFIALWLALLVASKVKNRSGSENKSLQNRLQLNIFPKATPTETLPTPTVPLNQIPEKQNNDLKKLPKTGPEVLLVTSMIFGSGLAGWHFFKKRSS